MEKTLNISPGNPLLRRRRLPGHRVEEAINFDRLDAGYPLACSPRPDEEPPASLVVGGAPIAGFDERVVALPQFTKRRRGQGMGKGRGENLLRDCRPRSSSNALNSSSEDV
jgi:hypothetical protein